MLPESEKITEFVSTGKSERVWMSFFGGMSQGKSRNCFVPDFYALVCSDFYITEFFYQEGGSFTCDERSSIFSGPPLAYVKKNSGNADNCMVAEIGLP